MGRGTIISGGTDGLYVVQPDYNTSKVDALIAKLQAAETTQQTKIDGIPAKYSSILDKKTAERGEIVTRIGSIPAEYDQKQTDIELRIVDLEAQLAAIPDDGTEEHTKQRQRIQGEIDGARKNLNTLDDQEADAIEKENENLRKKDEEISKLDKEQDKETGIERLILEAIIKQREQLDRLKPEENNVNVWCADYTTDISPGAVVGTIEVPGELGIMMLQPGYEGSSTYSASRDGQLAPDIEQRPYNWLLNKMILPGWQKHKPLYRCGVITAMDAENKTASIALDAYQSSAQNIDINQSSTLENVTFDYMDCGAGPFVVGDRVLIHFINQEWDRPHVIGFESHPKPCCVSSPLIYFGISRRGYEGQLDEYIFLWDPQSNAAASAGVTFPATPADFSEAWQEKLLNRSFSGTPVFSTSPIGGDPHHGADSFYPRPDCQYGISPPHYENCGPYTEACVPLESGNWTFFKPCHTSMLQKPDGSYFTPSYSYVCMPNYRLTVVDDQTGEGNTSCLMNPYINTQGTLSWRWVDDGVLTRIESVVNKSIIALDTPIGSLGEIPFVKTTVSTYAFNPYNQLVKYSILQPHSWEYIDPDAGAPVRRWVYSNSWVAARCGNVLLQIYAVCVVTSLYEEYRWAHDGSLFYSDSLPRDRQFWLMCAADYHSDGADAHDPTEQAYNAIMIDAFINFFTQAELLLIADGVPHAEELKMSFKFIERVST